MIPAYWATMRPCPTLIAVLAAFAAFTPVQAGGPHSLFIVDANSGATLTDIEGNDPRYPASLTKMMTLYLAFEAVEQGRMTMKTPIKISQAATNAAPSKLELGVGDEILLEAAIMALITKSANDVAIAVAEHIGGSEANFAKLMTAKAHDLGMKSTTFKNASGLPDGGQTTTARDMTTLGVRLYDDFPRYFPLFSTRSYTYNGSTFRNHNTLMLQMPGINGIKTGYTHASGFNLVSSLQQDGRHIVGAIFGGETAGSRNAQMRVALSRALAKASTVKTRKPVLVARAEAKAAAAAAKKAKAAAPAGVAAARPVPAVKPALAAPAPVESAAVESAAAAPASSLKVEMAKVRAVNVVNAAAPETPYARASASPRIASLAKMRVAQAPGNEPAQDAAPLRAEAEQRLPSSFETQMSGLAQNIHAAPLQPANAPVSQPVVTAPAPIAAARPPSSLGAQLAELTQQPPPPSKMPVPSYRLKGPDNSPRAAPGPASTGFEIQIGAYASAAEADKRLAAVQAQVASLAGRNPLRQSVTVGDKTLYRARFAGFDQASAQAACAELNRQSINCLALKAE